MKKVRFILIAIVLLVIFMPSAMAAQEYAYVSCGDAKGIPAPIPMITSIAYTLLIIGTPLILIIMSIIALAKAIVAQKADDIVKVRSTLIKKLVATALVFMVAGIAQFIITRAADDSEASTLVACLNCYLYQEGCIDWQEDLSYISDPNTNQHANTSSNQGPQNNNNHSNTNTQTATKNILVGDSKTSAMCGYNGSDLYVGSCMNANDYTAVSKVNGNYSFFTGTAIASVDQILAANSSTKYNIYILLGINDTHNSKNYSDKIIELASGKWKNHNIIYVSVTPVDSSRNTSVTQAMIDTFNSNVKTNLAGKPNIRYCDIATSLNVSGRTADGVHYTSELYAEVYAKLKTGC